MSAIVTSQVYVNGGTVTSGNLNAIATGSSISDGAIVGNTLSVVGGKLKIGTITSAEMGVGAVTTASLLDGNVTPAKLSVGYPVWTDSTAGSASLAIGSVRPANSGPSILTFDSTSPLTSGSDAKITRGSGINGDLTISNAGTGAITISNAGTGAIKFNAIPLGTSAGVAPIYGARAWVQFSSATINNGTFAGAGSTVNRSGSTTCTVNCASPHGLIVGNTIHPLTGVIVGIYTVDSVVSPLSFTFITTGQTGTLTSASITFSVQSIQASGNVNSVVNVSTGVFAMNFSIAMPNVNYAVSGSAFHTTGSGVSFSSDTQTLACSNITLNSFLAVINPTRVSAIVFA